jgi:glucose-6-phosphate dehydrogenase assembly protein OpcA
MEWISVSERMPATGQTVIVWARCLNCPLLRLYDDNLINYFAEMSGIGWDQITHWMPLPNPPKE